MDGRALDRTEGAKDTAVSGLRPKHHVAGRAFVEVDAGVRWHELFAGSAAVRAREHRAQDQVGPVHSTVKVYVTACAKPGKTPPKLRTCFPGVSGASMT